MLLLPNCVAVGLGDGFDVAVWVGIAVRVRVAVGLGDGFDVTVRLAPGVGVRVAVGLGNGVGDEPVFRLA